MSIDKLLMVAEWMMPHMMNLILRKLFPDPVLIDRVRVLLKGGSVFISPNAPVVRMTLEIQNSLACSIKAKSFQGDLKGDTYTLINNIPSMLEWTLEGHRNKDWPMTLDLPDAKAKIVEKIRADTVHLILHGTLKFNAIGRELEKPIKLPIDCVINGIHTDLQP